MRAFSFISIWCWLSLVIAPCHSLLGNEVQTLTDTQGRSLTAQILGIREGAVIVRRADNREFKLPLDKLNLPSRQIAMNWNRQEFLAQKIRAYQRLLQVREGIQGRESNEFLEVAALLGGTLLESGRPVEAIPLLEMAVTGMERNRLIDWRQHYATAQLGFARVCADIHDTSGYELMTKGYQGLSQTRDRLAPEKREWLVYQCVRKLYDYTLTAQPEAFPIWNERHAQLFVKIVDADPLPFEDIRMKRRESAHFNVGSPFVETSSFLKNAEAAWEFYADVIPGMREGYESGQFSPPYKLPKDYLKLAAGQEAEPFKFSIFLPSEEMLFEMAAVYSARLNDEEAASQVMVSAQTYRYFYDTKLRFYVAETTDPDTLDEKDDAFIFHRITFKQAEINLRTALQRDRVPSWLENGLGHCGESAVNTTIRNTFSGYDFPAAGLATRQEWFDPIRAILNRGKRISLAKSIDYEGTMEVHDYGYQFAMVHFLLADSERKQLLSDLTLAQGGVERYLKSEEVAHWFGFESVTMMELAVEEYIRSRDFN